MGHHKSKVMKKLVLLLIAIFCSLLSFSQSLIGAWEATTTSIRGDKIRNVVIFAEGYQVSTFYNETKGKFISTNGGSWSLEGDMLTETVEFDNKNPDRIGTSKSFQIKVKKKKLMIVGYKQEWKRIDNGTPGKLQGAWLMSGRVRDGKTQMRNTDRPRKTMKILSGTRFQWIAYNIATKEFKGTGGGTYTTKSGKYTENIEFFSRDDSKAGKSLQFDYEFVDGAWHHKGFSSKGAAMHEIWSARK